MRSVHSAIIGGALLVVLGTASAALSQENRYRPDWRPAPPPARDAGTLVRELGALIDEAERARAADPLFLRDLRDLALRYSWPWHRRVLFDDFADGDVSRDPAWAVSGRAVFVDRFSGVRTQVVPPYRPGHGDAGRRQDRQDVARQIFSVLLNQSAGDQRTDARSRRAPYEQPIELRTAAKLGNAFALRLMISSDTPDVGRIEIGVTQGAGDLGYRVAYNVGAGPSLELLRVGSRGTAVIDATRKPFRLEGGEVHDLLFTRDNEGTIAVSLDGAEAIRIRDQGFRDPFDGIVVVNKAGDFTVKSIAAYSG